MKNIPNTLFVIKTNDNTIRVYDYIGLSSHNKVVYQDRDYGFKETFTLNEVELHTYYNNHIEEWRDNYENKSSSTC